MLFGFCTKKTTQKAVEPTQRDLLSLVCHRLTDVSVIMLENLFELFGEASID